MSRFAFFVYGWPITKIPQTLLITSTVMRHNILQIGLLNLTKSIPELSINYWKVWLSEETKT